VAGAQAAGWASLLVTGGVHADRLRGLASRDAARVALQELVRDAGLARGPDAWIDQLVW
jgi:ribonucleotide monophosphatase NagD (HAD superfamily)